MKRIPIIFQYIVISLVLFSSPAWSQNNPPEAQTDWGFAEQRSTEFDAPIQWDISSFFTDPDGDPLTFQVPGWANPLPAGLTLDSNTGIISGALQSDGRLGRNFWFIAFDDSGERSAGMVFVLWTKLSYGANTSLFYRICDRFVDPIQCVPLADFPNKDNYRGIPSGFVGEERPDLNNSSSLYPDPQLAEPFRAAASVGYEGAELTPAISAYLRPAEERMTGQHFGLARHTLTGNLTINAELTFEQSGGAIAPASPNPGDDLDYAAIGNASLFAFQLAPEANGLFDPSLCDWNFFGPGAWGASIREALGCLRTPGMHPHVIALQEEMMSIPEPGPEVAGNPTVLPEELNGLAQGSLSIAYDPANPVVWIGIQMFQMARFHGEVNSQNTMRVSFDPPSAAAPSMETVTAPTFIPAPDDDQDLGVIPAAVTIGAGECLKINGQGKVKITIWGSDTLMVDDIDLESIEFGGLALSTNGNSGKLSCNVDDLDLDGDADLICRFDDNLSNWSGAEGAMEVTWMTYFGDSYYATDQVCLND